LVEAEHTLHEHRPMAGQRRHLRDARPRDLLRSRALARDDRVGRRRVTRFGFVGLGDQGGPMARRAIEAGLALTLHARRAAAVEPFLGLGAEVAGMLVDLAARWDVVAVWVSDDVDTKEV